MAALTVVLCSHGWAGTWRDDFEARDLRDWEIYNFDRVVEGWDAVDGTAVGEIFEPGYFSLLLLKPTNRAAEQWSNYTVRVRASLLRSQGDNHPRVGISLYDQEFEGNRYLFHLAYDTNELQIVRATPDFWQVLLFPAPDLTADTWYDLTASVATDGDTEVLTFQVNDGPEYSTQATGAFARGATGLVVSDGRAAFDDFQVSGASVSNGGRGQARTVSPADQVATTWAHLRNQ